MTVNFHLYFSVNLRSIKMHLVNKILSYFPHRHLFIAGVLGLIIGLVSSKALLSIAMMVIVGNALLNNRVLANFKTWLSEPASVLFLLFFLSYIISGLYSEDKIYWMERCRIKLPFIALPLGFAAVKPLSKKLLNQFLIVFVFVIGIASLWMMINYLSDFTHLNEIIKQGKPIPAPMNEHIRFSLEMAFAIICGGYLSVDSKNQIAKWLKYILGFITLFLLIAIHVFAVRSGIVALYASLFCIVLVYIFAKKKIAIGISILMLLFAMAWASLQFIPSLENKYGYFKYELQMIRNNEIKAEHSDAQRLVSMQLGIEIIRQHWLTGVGAGDIKVAMKQQYALKYPNEDFAIMTPHNQFIYVWVCTGIFGLLIFIAALFYPVFLTGIKDNILMIAFMVTTLVSIMTEHPFEIQLGTAFYMLFIALFLQHKKMKV